MALGRSCEEGIRSCETSFRRRSGWGSSPLGGTVEVRNGYNYGYQPHMLEYNPYNYSCMSTHRSCTSKQGLVVDLPASKTTVRPWKSSIVGSRWSSNPPTQGLSCLFRSFEQPEKCGCFTTKSRFNNMWNWWWIWNKKQKRNAHNVDQFGMLNGTWKQ